MSLTFEWDPKKADQNEKKHGVSFEEASAVFGDALSRTVSDPAHSRGERRFVTLGQSLTGRLVVVCHLDQKGGRIRIISARRATRKESRAYQEG